MHTAHPLKRAVEIASALKMMRFFSEFLLEGCDNFWVAKIGKMSIESRLEGANPHGE